MSLDEPRKRPRVDASAPLESPSDRRPSLSTTVSSDLHELSIGPSTSTDAAHETPVARGPDEDAREIVEFLDRYAAGRYPAGQIPPKPRGLVRGGNIARSIERLDYRQIVARYEADGTFIAPTAVNEKPRLRAFYRYGLPGSAVRSTKAEISS